MPDATLSRRRFLILGGGLVAATATGGAYLLSRDSSPTRVLASSPMVGEGEMRRRRSGGRLVEMGLTAAATSPSGPARPAPGPTGRRCRAPRSASAPETSCGSGSTTAYPSRPRCTGTASLCATTWTASPASPEDAIAAGADFTYEFTAPDPGTYL